MKKYQSFLSENFQFLEVKFPIYLNRCVFIMLWCWQLIFLQFPILTHICVKSEVKKTSTGRLLLFFGFFFFCCFFNFQLFKSVY